jgi:hypothetical protein
VLSREFILSLTGYIIKCGELKMKFRECQLLTNSVEECRKQPRPDVVAFPVCNGRHHFAILLWNRGGVLEVLTLDSNWSGVLSLDEYKLLSLADMSVSDTLAFQKLADQGTGMVVLGGYLKHVVALLAQIFWPEDMSKPRAVVQRFPLVPHQGSTNNCGVYNIYFLACLQLRPAEFLSAFAPGRRLVVGPKFGAEYRDFLLGLS